MSPLPPPLPPGPSAAPPPPTARAPGWWDRHWRGAALSIGVCVVLGFAALFLWVVGSFRDSVPYRYALHAVRTDLQAQAALGVPIEPSWMVQGHKNWGDGRETMNINFAVSGPRGEGRVWVMAEREGADGEWRYPWLVLERPGAPEPVDLHRPAWSGTDTP
jgi:hypothetical protein